MLLRCLLMTSLVVSCTSRSTVAPPTPSSPPPDTTPTPSFRIQYGLASWYGRERHGRRTASGEIFDAYQLVAAHRTAPFGTYALVTNLANGRTVQVRINDRGPSIAGRLVDLSYAAARQLDMVQVGVTRVKIELLAAPLPGYPSSQEDAPEPGDGLLYTAELSLPEEEGGAPRALRRGVGHEDEREHSRGDTRAPPHRSGGPARLWLGLVGQGYEPHPLGTRPSLVFFLRSRQRLIEIPQEIIEAFQANRDTDHIRADTGCHLLLIG